MNTIEKILETAAKAFAKQGFAGVRIDRLVKDAGINKATFYYHFKSKQEIFEKVVTLNFHLLQKKIDDRLFLCTTPEEKIAGFIDVMFEREQRDVLLIIREIIDGGDNISDEIMMLMSGIKERLYEILKEGKLQNVFKNDDPLLAMYLIMGITDFYIMSEPFRNKWKEFQNMKNVSPINLDEKSFVKKLKNTVMNFIKGDEK